MNEIRKTLGVATGRASGAPAAGIFGYVASVIASNVGGGAASSDEELPSTSESDEFIRTGTRGIVVCRCYCLKTESAKTFHINLYSGQISVYKGDGRAKKTHHCSDISNILVRSDHVVVLDMKRSRGLVVQKRFAFDSEESARLYQKYIEFRNDTGQTVRAAFDKIDRRGSKLITASVLKQALRAVDLEVSDEEVKIMLLLNNGNGEFFDFHDFVHVFIDTQVSTLRECLQEWLFQARELLKPRTGGGAPATVAGQVAPPQQPGRDADALLGMVRLVPGEAVAHVLDRVRWCLHMGKSPGGPWPYPGCLLVTNYRLVLLSPRKLPRPAADAAADAGIAAAAAQHSRYDMHRYFFMTSLPLSAIYRVQTLPPRNSLCITAKDYRVFRINVTSSGAHVRAAVAIPPPPSPFGGPATGPAASATAAATSASSPHMTLKADALVRTLQAMAFYANNPSSPPPAPAATTAAATALPVLPFAYAYRATFAVDGWRFADVSAEWRRQGILGCPEWRVFDNSTWALCESYPQQLVIPAAFADADVWTASSHRSKQRLPVVTYRHHRLATRRRDGPAGGADNASPPAASDDPASAHFPSDRRGASPCPVLTRSAQPMVGLSLKSCKADEALLNLYRLKGRSYDPHEHEDGPQRFFILDARRQIAATLNMAAGKGTEDISLYTHAELVFNNIDNIHVQRASAQNLADLLLPGGHLDALSRDSGGGAGYFAKLEESGWLRHVRLILCAGVLAAEKLHLEGASVLVHCSDGWDRTAQVCSVAQLLLDPHYRTLEGLAALIEKDWCAFGYKFAERCGHGSDCTSLPDERSPVFLQFLDTVFQLMRQFPAAFEYTEALLLFLADHAHSGLFGTFLGNTCKQRVQDLRAAELTASVWSYVLTHAQARGFRNPTYVPHAGPLWPSCSIARLAVWDRYYNRWQIEAHPHTGFGEDWHDDWGAGFETLAEG